MKYLPLFLAILFLLASFDTNAQRSRRRSSSPPPPSFQVDKFQALQWRTIGPFRGGRSVAVVGHPSDPLTYFFGSTGGGVWKTTDAGISWANISDRDFKSGSVGAIAVAPSDPNVLYVGMGEHAVRGVMTSHGDGVYKSTDGGASWQSMGLPNARHIAAIRIHPQNPDLVYVAVQGALYNNSDERGVYRTIDGGASWEKVHFVNATTGAADLSMDANNPRILYAGMWDHQRSPWQIRSGGPGSGIWKSTDGGTTWKKLEEGLPKEMGKVAVAVSPANPNRIYANIEAKEEEGGVYRSDDGGNSWKQVNHERVTVARAWYYIEIFADPMDENTVYVLNAPLLRSIDGGKTFEKIANPHSDQHDLWINPRQPQTMILANDGGACITFNGGKTWSTQNNQPTAQFYRVITDNQFPYHVYGGQQDNSTVAIASRTMGGGITTDDWYPVAGGESAFIAFNPNDPEKVYGTSIQGTISVWDTQTETEKSIMAYPSLNLGRLPKDMKYRFNWNNPIVAKPQDPNVLYYGAQLVLRTNDGGLSWTEISPDLTRDEAEKQGDGGTPYTNEAAGGEVYNTISYLACSALEEGLIWVGTDDGLVHITRDEGNTWRPVSPPNLGEALINAIEVSPRDSGVAYLAVTKYKFGDLSPMIYFTNNYGASWQRMDKGIAKEHFVRVVREDPKNKNLLYAGTEGGLYISFDRGNSWQPFQNNLPPCPITDLTIRDNDLVAATSGRAFWILDDLGALQQSMGKPDSTRLKLFTPKPTYKFTTGSPKENPAGQGQNPLNGVIFDYYLPHSFNDSTELILEISDANGNRIRTLSNQKPENFKPWEGGPPPPQVLPSKPGLNRFSWDLRRETLPAVDQVFVMGDYRGSLVGPGTYTFQLSADTFLVGTQVQVLADPRLRAIATPAEHEAQQQVLRSIEQAVRDIHLAVNRLRAVKIQLEERLALIEDRDDLPELKELGKAVQKDIAEWEAQLIQAKQKTFQDVINFPNQLSAEMLYLKAQVDSHVPALTESATARWEELSSIWEDQKKRMIRIIEDRIGNFNRMYEKRRVPALIVPNPKD